MNEFDDLEAALRTALARQDAPPGFAARVIARAGRRPMSRVVWASGIAAGVAVVLGVAPVIQHQRQEHAVRQTQLALRITAEKLNLVRGQIARGLSEPQLEGKTE